MLAWWEGSAASLNPPSITQLHLSSSLTKDSGSLVSTMQIGDHFWTTSPMFKPRAMEDSIFSLPVSLLINTGINNSTMLGAMLIFLVGQGIDVGRPTQVQLAVQSPDTVWKHFLQERASLRSLVPMQKSQPNTSDLVAFPTSIPRLHSMCGFRLATGANKSSWFWSIYLDHFDASVHI